MTTTVTLAKKLEALSDHGDVVIVKLSNGKHKVALVPFDIRLEACGEIAAIGFGLEKMVHVCWIMLANVMTTSSIRHLQVQARSESGPC